MSPWWRTRRSPRPRSRRASSARSIWPSFSGVTSSKCGIREARQGDAGLSAHGQAELAGDRADVGLGQPGRRPAGDGRRARWPPWPRAGRAADVIGVLPVRDRVQPQVRGDAGVDGGEQLVLAVVAAIRAVRPIGRPVTLAGLDLDHRHADLPGHRMGGARARRRPGSGRRRARRRPGRCRAPGRRGPAGRRSRRHRRRRPRAVGCPARSAATLLVASVSVPDGCGEIGHSLPP